MNEIEQVLTQFGGAFGGAAGPVRSVAGRTCDLLPTAARVAEFLHPTLDLGERVGRLSIRLTHGVPAEAVDLARQAAAGLLRGDYVRLAAAGLCEPDMIDAAEDETILECIDRDQRKLALVRAAVAPIRRRRARLQGLSAPVLDAYVA